MQVPSFLMILVGARGFECARGAQASLEAGLPANLCGGFTRKSVWRVYPPIFVAGFDAASIISSHFLPLPDLRNFSRTLAAL